MAERLLNKLPPFGLALLAGLPITLCIVIMGLPDLGREHEVAFYVFFVAAYIVWTVPLTLVQRWQWLHQTRWWKIVITLLAITYLMSVINNSIALSMAIKWNIVPTFHPALIFSKLAGCWLPLVAYCAIHACVAYYSALLDSKAQLMTATVQARDAELRALRYQLHPHFMFNTLNAVSALIASDRNREANRVVARLGDFLRATLESGSRNEVSLAEEISLTETYLDVEKARLGERLVVGIQLGPDVMNASVPHLLLQPLVENAVRHAIWPSHIAGKLTLRAWRDRNTLRLLVINDGYQEGMHSINDAASQSMAVGLNNIRSRLATLYPGAYEFIANPTSLGDFEVHICIPFKISGDAEAGAAPIV